MASMRRSTSLPISRRAVHVRVDVAEDERIVQRGAADHHAVDAGRLEHADRVGGRLHVAVAEHRDRQLALHLRDVLPVARAGVGLVARAAVDGDRGHADLLEALEQRDDVVALPPLAHLHRDRDLHRGFLIFSTTRAALSKSFSSAEPGAAVDDFPHRAAHVDVDDVDALGSRRSPPRRPSDRDRRRRSGSPPAARSRRTPASDGCGRSSRVSPSAEMNSDTTSPTPPSSLISER